MTVQSFELTPHTVARSDRRWQCLIKAGLLLALWIVSTSHSAEAADKSLHFRVLGQPTADKPETARKINDLMLFDGRLYLGHGDWFKNSGPTDVMYCDIVTQKFVNEFTVDDEAIVRYRRHGNRLFVPGTDATESWEFGNLYVREASAWKKFRTIPRGLHVFDFAEHAGRWYVATGSYFNDRKTGPWIGAVYSSDDEALSWRYEYTTESARGTVSRITSLMPYKDRLFAFGYTDGPEPRNSIHRPANADENDQYNRVARAAVYDGVGWFPADILPEADLVQTIEPLVFADRLLLNVRHGRYGEQFTNDWQLYAHDGDVTRRVPLECDRIVDMLVSHDRLILLIVRQGKNVLVESTDLVRWKSQLVGPNIEQPLSVEYDGHSYYLGLTDGTVLASPVSRD